MPNVNFYKEIRAFISNDLQLTDTAIENMVKEQIEQTVNSIVQRAIAKITKSDPEDLITGIVDRIIKKTFDPFNYKTEEMFKRVIHDAITKYIFLNFNINIKPIKETHPDLAEEIKQHIFNK